MNREGIRRLAAETLGLPTSPYRFADTLEELRAAVAELGMPVRDEADDVLVRQGPERLPRRRRRRGVLAVRAWTAAAPKRQRVIVEGFVDFDYEITLLTVRSASGTVASARRSATCRRTATTSNRGSRMPMTRRDRASARRSPRKVTDELGGYGIFGVELFVTGDGVWFSEVSPRPHDTGMVTMATQDLSRVRAARARDSRLADPGDPLCLRPGASYTLKADRERGRVPDRRREAGAGRAEHAGARIRQAGHEARPPDGRRAEHGRRHGAG